MMLYFDFEKRLVITRRKSWWKVKWCETGPPKASVTDVKSEFSETSGSFKKFTKQKTVSLND